MFSATMTDEVDALIQNAFNQPVRVEAAPTGTPLENIIQSAYEVPNFYTKVNLLRLLLNDEAMSKVLVFTATKQLADQVFEELEGHYTETIGIIHSNKSQNHRFNAVKQFHDGSFRILIATDIVARGIDISEVTHVVNFDTPEVPESYMHRIGRTGRADKKGIAITFIVPNDAERLERMETLMSYKIPVTELPEDLFISNVLTEDEKPKVYQPNMEMKAPRKAPSGPAFHEKLDKNLKVSVKVTRADKLREKYGKPKTRGQKMKKKK